MSGDPRARHIIDTGRGAGPVVPGASPDDDPADRAVGGRHRGREPGSVVFFPQLQIELSEDPLRGGGAAGRDPSAPTMWADGRPPPCCSAPWPACGSSSGSPAPSRRVRKPGRCRRSASGVAAASIAQPTQRGRSRARGRAVAAEAARRQPLRRLHRAAERCRVGLGAACFCFFPWRSRIRGAASTARDEPSRPPGGRCVSL